LDAPITGAGVKTNTRDRQQVSNVKNLLFNIREPPETIVFSLFAAPNVDALRIYSRQWTFVKSRYSAGKRERKSVSGNQDNRNWISGKQAGRAGILKIIID
jgi:hypothetical protein